MHVIPFLRNFYNRYFFYHVFFEQNFDGLVRSFHRSAFAHANQQMIFAYYHHITAFQCYFVIIAFFWQQEMMKSIWYFNDIIW